MKPLPWSHSTIEKFKTCPKQYYHTKVAKDVVETAGEAATWGTRLHEAFEEGLKTGAQLPVELSVYQHYVDQLSRFSGVRYVEYELGVTRDLKPCGFRDDEVWSRGIIDVLIVRGDKAFILDHKSGKVKPSTQLMLNSLLVFANFPEVNICRTVFYWLQSDTMTVGHHTRNEAPALWDSYAADLKRYEYSFEQDIWLAKQSGLCFGWCPVTSCQFWKQKRS